MAARDLQTGVEDAPWHPVEFVGTVPPFEQYCVRHHRWDGSQHCRSECFDNFVALSQPHELDEVLSVECQPFGCDSDHQHQCDECKCSNIHGLVTIAVCRDAFPVPERDLHDVWSRSWRGFSER
ncbi:hypothetical protein HYQ46_001570 [Verticillium longisporum]|nr:hypothetical protein HYQ46_001570 [Verticillium longisporum]